MTKTKRIFTTIIAFTLIICTLCAASAPAAAATYSSGTQTRTITVKTKANYWIPGSESITISQAKGTCVAKSYNFITRKTTTKTTKQYGTWIINVRSTDGRDSYSKRLTGSSIKLNLKPNKTYTITITWDSQAAFFKTLDKGNYTSYPTWKVKSTWKVSDCY
jgi:hypothetical protein